MKISSILKQKRTWSIMLFYVLAVLIRVVSTHFETIDPSHVKLWDFVGGLSPLIGAIVVILALRRKMKTSLFGTSGTKSILTLAVPLVLLALQSMANRGCVLLCLVVPCFFWSWQAYPWYAFSYTGGLLPWSVQFLFQMPLRPKPLVVNRLSRHHHHAVTLHLVWVKSQDLLEIM